MPVSGLCKHKSFTYLTILLYFRSSDESQVTFDVDSFTKALDRILGEIACLFLCQNISWLFGFPGFSAHLKGSVLICLISELTQNDTQGQTQKSWILMIWMKIRSLTSLMTMMKT